MAETVEPAEAEERETATAEGCPVKMYRGRRCGRLLYNATAGVDKVPVCLMHSLDPDKDNEAFQREFERILEEAGEGVADFTGFVFPRADYVGREFKARCIFGGATFTQEADFSRATFTQGANFGGATFTQEADFSDATFTQEAYFGGATFTQKAYFGWATFTQEADFSEATFTQWADFSDATFTQRADFNGATFTQAAVFGGATFTQEAYFVGATFTQWADFHVATFTRAAYFYGAKLWGEVDGRITGYADFRWAKFLSGAEFRETQFREDGKEIGAVFSLARFEKPEEVVFYKTYLGQALFHNCDVSKFVFSSVTWRERDNGKRMVFEEFVSLEHDDAEALKPPEGSADKRNYGLIAELYQQLKKNFDDRRDYWTAGDFHWGEMEMKRLSSPRRRVLRRGGLLKRWFGRVLGGRSITVAARIGCGKRWLHRNLGLAAWYKYASEYGESYKRPAAWLGIFLLLFMLAYPDFGLQHTDGIPTPTSEIHYKNFFQFLEAHPKGAWAFFGHSLMTALSVMALQREFEYQPVYPLGRPVLTVLELVLSSTLIALFLLAVRRQFRR